MWKAIVGTSRPPFLILAPLCVSVAVAYAFMQGSPVSTLHVVFCYIAALLAHASVNMLNEYHDNDSGLDYLTERTPFSGGSGTLQQWTADSKAVRNVACVFLLVTIFIGLYFVWLRGLALLIIGLLASASVWFYTPHLNRFPWLCLIAPGFGFAIALTLGSFIAVTGAADWGIVLLSAPLFFLANNLLLLNQFPDKSADKKSGRNHLIIHYGESAGRTVYILNLIALVLCTFAIIDRFGFGRAGLALLLSPLASLNSLMGLHRFITSKDLGAFLPYLASNVIAVLSYPVILSGLLFLRHA